VQLIDFLVRWLNETNLAEGNNQVNLKLNGFGFHAETKTKIFKCVLYFSLLGITTVTGYYYHKILYFG